MGDSEVPLAQWLVVALMCSDVPHSGTWV